MKLHMQIPTVIEAVLTTVVVLIAGFGIHRRTINQLTHGALSMDTLVSLGSIAALVRSFLLWQQGIEMTRFESTSTIIVFVLLGRYLEASTRLKTFSATAELFKTLEQDVTLIYDKVSKKISGLLLKADDVFLLNPGDSSPADGVIVSGNSHVNTARITGESVPLSFQVGDTILSGSTIIESPLTIRVTKSSNDSFIGRLLTELEKAQSTPVKLQRLSDRITNYFVPIVILLGSISAYAQYLLTSNPNFAFNVLLSVLLVACPCAIGLAIPTALVAALGASAKHGILFRNAEVLEACHKIDEIFFDKTGTLTIGKPTVSRIQTFGQFSERDVLNLAALLETQSDHPLAQAIRAKAVMTSKPLNLANFKILSGQGVEATIDNQKIKLIKLNNNEALKIESTASDLFIDNVLASRFFFEDELRPETLGILKELKKQKIKLHLLTGDNKASAVSIQNKLDGIFDEVHSNLLPQDKQLLVKKARELNPAGVAFIGDGTNDVLALAAAAVGFSIAEGSPAAIGAGHVTLTHGISDLLLALQSAKFTARQIKFNLFYAIS
jgi:Cu+-exporting ATPase